MANPEERDFLKRVEEVLSDIVYETRIWQEDYHSRSYCVFCGKIDNNCNMHHDHCAYARSKELLQIMTAMPTCKKCGSIDLRSDPAGYYNHAVDYLGNSLSCPVCIHTENKANGLT